MTPTSGAVAQMGERCNRTAEVRGSIPLGSTSPHQAPLKRQCIFEGFPNLLAKFGNLRAQLERQRAWLQRSVITRGRFFCSAWLAAGRSHLAHEELRQG